MLRTDNVTSDLVKSLTVALLAFALSFAAYSVSAANFIPLGNLLVFLGAQAFSGRAALVSAVVGSVPIVLVTHDVFLGIRLLAISATIVWCSRRAPRLPAFLVALAAWTLVLGPLSLALRSSLPHVIPPGTGDLLLAAAGDVVSTVVSGTILLSPTVWCFLTHQPRRLTISLLVTQIVTSITLVAALGALLIPLAATGVSVEWVLDQSSPMSIVAVLCFCLLVPALLADRLAAIITEDYRELSGTSMMIRSLSTTFSGLSSDYWRRQSSTDSLSATAFDSTRTSTSIDQNSDAPSKLPREEGICALNRDGTITFVNRKFRRLAHMTVNDVIGRSIHQVGMPPLVVKHIEQLIDATFARGETVSELRVAESSTRIRFFEIASLRPERSSLQSLGNGPDSVIITIKDVTERRTVEQHLLHAQKLKSMGTLVAEIARSFNNSLTAITGYASYALHAKEADDVRKSLGNIIENGKSAGSLVRQLLDFAHEGPALMKSVSISRALEDRLPLLRKLLGDECTLEFSSTVPLAQVECDLNLVFQAVANVVQNSREAYGDTPGKVSVTLDRETIAEEVSHLHVGVRPGDFLRIRVVDTGAGMTPETVAKAFEPLYTTKKASGHAGLGLSIVFAIVRAHDGFLTTESHPGTGTTLSIYLPLAEGETTSVEVVSEGESESGQIWRGNSERILVVEDEAEVRVLLSTMLRGLGYDVTTCADGGEALSLKPEQEFDVVLVDGLLPRMSGLQLISKLRELNIASCYIVMTDKEEPSDPDVRADAFLRKPFDMETLAFHVQKSLRASGREIH